MCIFTDSTNHYLMHWVHSKRPKSFRKVETVPRQSARVNHRISTPLSLFSALIIALSCIADGEHNQVNQHPLLSRGDATSPLSKPLLTNDQLDAYTRDGFIVISGLLDNTELNGLVDAGESIVSKHLQKSGGKMLPNGNFQVTEFGLILHDERFRDVALHSKLPLAAAELMQLDSNTQNLRVLRDVFLAKGHESNSSCGWHLDDMVFWPAAYQLPRPHQVDQSGVNAWIALDDMPIENGGSMAVSPSSHAKDFSWRSEALAALNFDDKFGNGVSKDDLFEMIKSGKVDSCGLEKVAPHVYDDIELSKQEFNFKRGDTIFMNRWLFHKTTDMTEKGKLALQAVQNSFIDDQTLLKRYSIRFATGDTSLPEGFMTEMSVLASDGLNLGKHLNNVSGEWYPKCWPEVDIDVNEKIDYLVRNEVPIAQGKLGVLMAEAMKIFQSR